MSPRLHPPVVLIATDQDPALEELVRLVERRGYTALRARSGAAALELARVRRPDVIILDEIFPDFEGLALSRALRGGIVRSSAPILMTITGAAGSVRHLDALRAGVWEFVAWPMSEVELASKIDNYIVAKLDADRARREEPLDAATGLEGVHGLSRRARELAVQAYHHHAPMACVIFAPDEAAAAALVGRALRARGRRTDAIGRLAALEFAVVAAGADATAAEQLADRLAAEVRQAAEAVGASAPRLRAGFHAVPNVHYTPVEPMGLLSRAAAALRLAREGGHGWIRGSQTGDGY